MEDLVQFSDAAGCGSERGLRDACWLRLTTEGGLTSALRAAAVLAALPLSQILATVAQNALPRPALHFVGQLAVPCGELKSRGVD